MGCRTRDLGARVRKTLHRGKRLEPPARRRDQDRPSRVFGLADTFYVGTLKGMGRVYRQTFVDSYVKAAFTKLYTT